MRCSVDHRFPGLGACALLLGACTGQPKILPPREPPPRSMPPVALPPAPAPLGHGRLVLHGTDGTMRIAAQADTAFIPPGQNVPATRTGELCSHTPCVVDLPAGRYSLYLSSADGSFQHGDTDVLQVSEGVTYYVRAPGRYEPPKWLKVLPGVLLIGAGAFVITGAGLLYSRDDALKAPGALLLGGGVALGTWGGIELYDAARAKQQAGTTTTWRP